MTSLEPRIPKVGQGHLRIPPYAAGTAPMRRHLPNDGEGRNRRHQQSLGTCLSQGDLNGDGVADAIFGSHNLSLGTKAGGVYVVFGPATGTGSISISCADLILRGELESVAFGAGNTTGAVDHDGIHELPVGSPGEYIDSKKPDPRAR